MAERQHFTSRISTVLTMIGVAVGLGNVWRFPYMMGQFGGSAFLIVYILFVVAFALPALMGEWALGRSTRRGPLGAFTTAIGPSGRSIGALLLVTVFIANSYYLVVIANVGYTAVFSIVRGFSETQMDSFQQGLNTGPLQALIGVATIASAMFVLHRGLRKGVERISKVFVPFFGIVITYLIITSLQLPNAVDHLRDFLRPDFRAMTATNIFAAMGQAFFSLSLGGTFYLIYGSYLRVEENIPKSASITAFGDVAAALLAALFIVPTTLVFDLDLESGPTLIFQTLPQLFAHIPAGRVLGSCFLVALWMVAYLSSVAAFQVVYGALRDEFSMSSTRAVTYLGLAEAMLMIPIAMKPQIIGTLDLIFGSGMQVLGSGLALAALTWGLGRVTVDQELFPGNGQWKGTLYFLWAKWIVPVGLVILLGLWIWQSFLAN